MAQDLGLTAEHDTYSHTMLSTWRRCRLKFYLKYIANLEEPKSLGLQRGSAGHKALETYYGDPKRSIEAAIEAAHAEYVKDMQPDQEFNEQDWDELVDALVRYDRFALEHDNFVVREVENYFKLDLGNGFQFQGLIDAVVENNSGVWLMEHKFLKRVSTNHLNLDPQVSAYLAAAVAMDLEPSGVIYNMVRIGGGPTAVREPVVRRFVYRDIAGLRLFIEELKQQAEEAHQFAKEVEGRKIYRNLTSDCTWDCQFQDVCLLANNTGVI